MQPSTPVRVTIATDKEPLSVLELSTYLHHFRAAYVLCVKELETSSSDDKLTLAAATSLAQRVLSSHKGLADLNTAAESSLPEDRDMLLVDIRRENPIGLTLFCVVVAATGAVIISGGKIKFDAFGVKLELDLPPLGKGIAEIKKAFQSGEIPPPQDPKA